MATLGTASFFSLTHLNKVGRTSYTHRETEVSLQLSPNILSGGEQSDGGAENFPVNPETHDAFVEPMHTGKDWFDKVHIDPHARLEFGNIVSATEASFWLYSAYRTQSTTLTAIDNPTNLGLSFPDFPSLPAVLPPSRGFFLPGEEVHEWVPQRLQVSADGAASFLHLLAFTFSTGDVPGFEVSGTRIIFLPVLPQGPTRETWEWLTDLIPLKSGLEQAIALRKNPRQVLQGSFHLESLDRRLANTLLYDWHSRLFALPLPFEHLILNEAIATEDETTEALTGATAYVDFRVGGPAVMMSDSDNFEILTVSEIQSDRIVFSSQVLGNFPAGTKVMPVRYAHMAQTNSGVVYPVNVDTLDFTFRATDNDTGAIEASFGSLETFEDLPIIGELNWLDGGRGDYSWDRDIQIFDGGTGLFQQVSNWPHDLRQSSIGFQARSRQDIYNLRRMFMGLRGRQVVFWTPTHREEMVAAEDLEAATDTITIENINYARFGKARSGRNVIRVNLLDGTSVIRRISDYAEIDETTEEITVDAAWDETIAVADIDYIEYLELVRLNSDNVTFNHSSTIGQSEVTVPVRVAREWS